MAVISAAIMQTATDPRPPLAMGLEARSTDSSSILLNCTNSDACVRAKNSPTVEKFGSPALDCRTRLLKWMNCEPAQSKIGRSPVRPTMQEPGPLAVWLLGLHSK